MDKKDLLEIKIRAIMEEETSELFLSDKIKEDLLKTARQSPFKGVKELLNKQKESPHVPIGAGLVAGLILLIVPIEGFLKSPQVKTIDFGSSQVIIRDYKEVSKR